MGKCLEDSGKRINFAVLKGKTSQQSGRSAVR